MSQGVTPHARSACRGLVGCPLSLAALLLTSACGILEPHDCTTEFRFGLAVAVRDSVTGVPIASGARLETRKNGVVIDSGTAYPNAFPPNQPVFDAQELLGAGERAGRYLVTVRKAGYRDWVRSDVVVGEDECHVRPVRLTARLQPLP